MTDFKNLFWTHVNPKNDMKVIPFVDIPKVSNVGKQLLGVANNIAMIGTIVKPMARGYVAGGLVGLFVGPAAGTSLVDGMRLGASAGFTLDTCQYVVRFIFPWSRNTKLHIPEREHARTP